MLKDKIKRIKKSRLTKYEIFLYDIFNELEIEEVSYSDIINYKYNGNLIITKNTYKKIVDVYFYEIYGDGKEYFSEPTLINMLNKFIHTDGYLLTYNLKAYYDR